MNSCLNYLSTLLLLCWSLVAANAKTDEMRTVTVNGVTRSYWLYVPDKVSASAPLVLSLHGTVRFRDGMQREKTAKTSTSSKPSSTMSQPTSALTESASIAVDSPMVA